MYILHIHIQTLKYMGTGLAVQVCKNCRRVGAGSHKRSLHYLIICIYIYDEPLAEGVDKEENE